MNGAEGAGEERWTVETAAVGCGRGSYSESDSKGRRHLTARKTVQDSGETGARVWHLGSNSRRKTKER